MSSEDFFKKLSDSHPFITVCHYASQDYVGIVQNRDDIVTTIYDYGSIVETELKENQNNNKDNDNSKHCNNNNNNK